MELTHPFIILLLSKKSMIFNMLYDFEALKNRQIFSIFFQPNNSSTKNFNFRVQAPSPRFQLGGERNLGSHEAIIRDRNIEFRNRLDLTLCRTPICFY